MRNINRVFLLFFVLSFLISCGGKMETSRIGNPGAANKVLIALEPTEYKRLVAEELIKKLDDKNDNYVTLSGLPLLKKITPADFDAVIILNTGKAGKPDKAVLKFLKKFEGADNIVVYTTWGDENTKTDLPVDSISSASDELYIPVVRDEILRLMW